MTTPRIPENDLEETALGRLATQYRNSVNMRGMVSTVVDESTELQAALFEVLENWNLDDATGYMLDVIGIIVGLPRPLIDNGLFGFFGWDGDPGTEAWGEITDPSAGGRWLSVFGVTSGFAPMEDPDYRTHIRAQIIRNQTNSSSEAALEILNAVFPDAGPIVIVNGPLAEADITFGRDLSSTEIAWLQHAEDSNGSTLVPAPPGVAITYNDQSGPVP